MNANIVNRPLFVKTDHQLLVLSEQLVRTSERVRQISLCPRDGYRIDLYVIGKYVE